MKNKRKKGYYRLLRRRSRPIEKAEIASRNKGISITKTRYGEIKVSHPETQTEYTLRRDIYTGTWTVFKTTPLPEGIGRRYDIIQGGSVLRLEAAKKLATEKLLTEIGTPELFEERETDKLHAKGSSW